MPRSLFVLALLLFAALGLEVLATSALADVDACCACDGDEDGATDCCADDLGRCACASHVSAEAPRVASDADPRPSFAATGSLSASARTLRARPRGPPPTPPPIG